MSSHIEVVQSSLEALPVFPLPAAVLFPGELLPLHVFEPRYREMTAHLLKTRKALAIARLEEGWEKDYDGRPPIDRCCGAGVVLQSHALPDGRYNLLVQGVARVFVEEELPPTRSFREVRARLLEDHYPHGGPAALAPEVEALNHLLLSLASARSGPGVKALLEAVAAAPDPGAKADHVLAALVGRAEKRQLALTTTDVEARLSMARSVVMDVLAEGSPGGPPDLLN